MSINHKLYICTISFDYLYNNKHKKIIETAFQIKISITGQLNEIS